MAASQDETPLRRSVMESIFNKTVITPKNDVEQERCQAERYHRKTTSEAFENNETLKKCMDFYNDNRLSRENSWNLSLIDTLSNLLYSHNKSINNFKIAGYSLEASSKVYALRVDSIHNDVIRMSARLNATKFNENVMNIGNADDDDDNNASHRSIAEMCVEVAGLEYGEQEKLRPKKRTRKTCSTVTKNKDTLNACLDTVSMKDPIFEKLNSIVYAINATNRLMNNILPTKDSELCLRTNYRFWDDSSPPEDMDYTVAEMLSKDYVADQWVNADWLVKLHRYDHLLLRPMYTGYIITDTPNTPNNQSINEKTYNFNSANMVSYRNLEELSMTFDINAASKPFPDLSANSTVLDVDPNDLEELTNDMRKSLNFCRGLCKPAVVIDDLRPIDASSKLEYSYRPMDKITQFWAGPSHWKFKRPRTASKTLTQQAANLPEEGRAYSKRCLQQENRRRSKRIRFGEFNEENFISITENTKLRKANVQKNWDSRKLKLPTNLKVDKELFFKYDYAPGLTKSRGPNVFSSCECDDGECTIFGEVDVTDGRVLDGLSHTPNVNVSTGNAMNTLNVEKSFDIVANVDTIQEIATEFVGPLTQITKVIVPFSHRAKVIDMKNVKRCCSELINKQFANPIDENTVPQHPTVKGEEYTTGVASFNDVYKKLPENVAPAMADSLSTAVAFYSVLHVASEQNLRLIPQKDLEDFKIRKIVEK